MRFTLPALDAKSTKDIKNLVTNKNLSAIADKFVRGTALDDVIFQGIDKLLVCFNTINISNLGVCTTKQDSGSRTVSNGRGVGVENITGNRLVPTRDIQRRVRGLEGTFQ
jgi:hypothetical protein